VNLRSDRPYHLVVQLIDPFIQPIEARQFRSLQMERSHGAHRLIDIPAPAQYIQFIPLRIFMCVALEHNRLTS
jgi:hypothetical protein